MGTHPPDLGNTDPPAPAALQPSALLAFGRNVPSWPSGLPGRSLKSPFLCHTWICADTHRHREPCPHAHMLVPTHTHAVYTSVHWHSRTCTLMQACPSGSEPKEDLSPECSRTRGPTVPASPELSGLILQWLPGALQILHSPCLAACSAYVSASSPQASLFPSAWGAVDEVSPREGGCPGHLSSPPAPRFADCCAGACPCTVSPSGMTSHRCTALHG